MRAGADINQSIRSFDQCRQNVGREHINGEDAGDSRLNLHPSLAITDAGIVDDSVKAAELVDLVGNCAHPGDCGQVPGDGPASQGCRREGGLTSTVIASVHDDLMTLLDQDLRRHKTQAVR